MPKVLKSVLAQGVLPDSVDDKISTPYNAQELPLGFLEGSFVQLIGSIADSTKIKLVTSATATDDQQLSKWGAALDAASEAYIHSVKVTKIINENVVDIPTLSADDRQQVQLVARVKYNDSRTEYKKVYFKFVSDGTKLETFRAFLKNNIRDLYFGDNVYQVTFVKATLVDMFSR